MDNGDALSLNLTIWVGAATHKMTQEHRDLPTFQGNSSWMLPIPGDVRGRAGPADQGALLGPDYRKPVAIADMLAALRS